MGFKYRDTYNIVLELADMTLEQFFNRSHSMFRAEEFYNFWKNVLEMVQGILVIHEDEITKEDARSSQPHEQAVLRQG